MRVVGSMVTGAPEVLEVLDLPEPHAGPGEVRIRVHGACVNPTDILRRSDAAVWGDAPPPYIPGMDVAGVIDEVGADVTGFVVGDQVMAMILPNRPAGGAYAEFVVVSPASVTYVPEGMDLARAATIPMNGLTAVRALDLLALDVGARLLVTGAAGALGGYVVQLARARGLEVVAMAESADADRLRGYGASEVVSREGLDPDRDLISLASMDAVVDCALVRERVIPFVKDGGQVAAVRAWEYEPPRGIRVVPVWVRDYVDRADLQDELRASAERGEFIPCEVVEMDASQAPEAHRRMEAGGIRGRIVLTF